MSLRSRYYANLYKDSVSLLKVSVGLSSIAGIEAASVVMATPVNVENLAVANLGAFAVSPNDLLVAVSGSDVACAEALAKADELLLEQNRGDRDVGPEAAQPISTLHQAISKEPSKNFALVSVPGDYAAAEAMKALRLGMDVMVFSDNVSVEAELALKRYAEQHGLMVMGPDCGTAIVNGIPLGFANVVRRGPIGVVGASGTGTQEVTVRIHQRGSGVSQALGTGGHDLAASIGGISMLHGLKALNEDPATQIIVLVSKPPAPEVADAVLRAARACQKPVVVSFLGADPASITQAGVYGAAYLAQAADMAVALANGERPERTPIRLSSEQRSRLTESSVAMAPSQRYVRGVFSGGTFCFEAQLIHAAAGHSAFSNAPTAGNEKLEHAAVSRDNTLVDMGEDEFTRGRPHPMIDPSLRNARVREEALDPSTAVVLFDVVLGYGSAAAPVSGLTDVIRSAAATARVAGRRVAFIGHVCGTDQDPQDRDAIVAELESVGVLVACSNAEAALWSATIISERAR